MAAGWSQDLCCRRQADLVGRDRDSPRANPQLVPADPSADSAACRAAFSVRIPSAARPSSSPAGYPVYPGFVDVFAPKRCPTGRPGVLLTGVDAWPEGRPEPRGSVAQLAVTPVPRAPGHGCHGRGDRAQDKKCSHGGHRRAAVPLHRADSGSESGNGKQRPSLVGAAQLTHPCRQ